MQITDTEVDHDNDVTGVPSLTCLDRISDLTEPIESNTERHMWTQPILV